MKIDIDNGKGPVSEHMDNLKLLKILPEAGIDLYLSPWLCLRTFSQDEEKITTTTSSDKDQKTAHCQIQIVSHERHGILLIN